MSLYVVFCLLLTNESCSSQLKKLKDEAQFEISYLNEILNGFWPWTRGDRVPCSYGKPFLMWICANQTAAMRGRIGAG